MNEEGSRKKANQSNNNYSQVLLKLSPREGQVLTSVAQGKTIAEIAEQLHLSVRTVENHRYHICKKLGLKGKGALKKMIRQTIHSEE